MKTKFNQVPLELQSKEEDFEMAQQYYFDQNEPTLEPITWPFPVEKKMTIGDIVKEEEKRRERDSFLSVQT